MHKIVFVKFNKKNKNKKVERKVEKRLKEKQDDYFKLKDFVDLKKKSHVKKIFNYKYVVPIVIILTGIVYSVNLKKLNVEYVENNSILVNQDLNDKEYAITEYSQTEDDKIISVYYPVTKYETLNKEILDKLEAKLNEYKNDNYYNITGDFEYFQKDDIISIMFNLAVDLKGAHPIEDKLTINYDIVKDKVVGINDFIQDNNYILETLSEYTYNKLLEDEKLKDKEEIMYMIKEGTTSKKENFLNLLYKDEGLEVVFKPYQVAPYYLGEFRVLVPYEILD